jgi:hypothetical protein
MTADRGHDAASPVLPYIYRVTKYDPADRDEHGHYQGAEDIRSDQGPTEAAYLTAVAAFAADSDITQVAIREPEVALAFVHFGLEPAIDGHGLAGLFPPDLTGYHDGAEVPMTVALELVRAMLRDNGAWCRLEVDDQFLIHVGWDQYLYVGSTRPCHRAVAVTHQQGLFAERLTQSPYDKRIDDEPAARCADASFWTDLSALTRGHGTVLLEEGYVHNTSRWHRVTVDTLDATRALLTPRSRLLIWPDLRSDVAAVLAELPDEGLSEIVWQDRDGALTSRCISEEHYGQLPILLAEATAATSLSNYADDRRPLLTGVLPDPDGVLRARWTP